MITNPLDHSRKSPIFIEKDRNDLAVLFKELGFKIGAEIGVFSGAYSEILCQTITGLELYCIDAWTKYEGYHDVRGEQERYDRIYEQAKTRLSSFNCHLIKKWSMDAVNDIPDESLDFIYIDGNHDFEHCTEDITSWSRKVRSGGIISGHDFRTCNSDILKIQVQDAVTAWTNTHQISPWYVLVKDKKSPSWMWYKTI
jgi:predicted O-methyltransferase YrrM